VATPPTWCGWCVGVSGRVKLRMQLVIRFGFGADVPWVKKNADGSALLAICGPDMTVLRTPVATRGRGLDPRSPISRVGEGPRQSPSFSPTGPSHFAGAGADRSRARPAGNRSVLARMGALAAAMRTSNATLVMRFADHAEGADLRADRRHCRSTHNFVCRKKTRRRAQTGTIASAGCATPRFTLLALNELGAYTEEAARLAQLAVARGWRDRRPILQIMYGHHGGSGGCWNGKAAWLPGYERARSRVRVGNAAARPSANSTSMAS